MKKAVILYRPHEDKTVKEPIRGSLGAAGWDIYAGEDTELKPLRASLVATNFDIAIPKNHALLMMPRSGFSIVNQIIMPNSVGLIDQDYRGHLRLSCLWIPDEENQTRSFEIHEGDRIAQAVLIEYVTQEWISTKALPPTERGKGGFGSTGLK